MSYGTFGGSALGAGGPRVRVPQRTVIAALFVLALAAAVAVVAVATMEDSFPSVLFDSLDHRRGRSFPQNEQAWLEMVSNKGTPLFAKTSDEIKQLDDIRDKAAAWVAQEKKEAYATAQKLAVSENYVTYDKFKGVATHKDTGAPAPAAK